MSDIHTALATGLGTVGKNLEDEFFARKQAELIQKMRAERAREENRAHLAHVTGIEDRQLLDALVDPGLHAESLAALSLVPMVEVAWADGTVDAEERAALLKVAAEHGLTEVGHELLASWLDQRPAASLLVAWEAFARQVSGALDADGRARLAHEILSHARFIAEAAGGFLGIGKVSKEEKAVLARLEAALQR